MKKIVVIAFMMLFGFMQANAAGTDTNYDTDIINSATLSYEVNGLAQTDKISNTDTFKVDRKVDVLVATTDTENQIVVPNDNIAADNKPLTFTVTNETNGAQDYILNASNLATGSNTLDSGETDSVDFAADLKICTDATCSGGDISGTNIPFTEDETKTYYVFADIPSAAADGDRGSIALTATAVDDGTTTVMTDDRNNADDPAVVDIVFADDAGDASGDGQHDGKHSALSAYEVVTATLDATKTSCVIWDPVNITTNPKRIPGAVVRYAVDINNTGTADATTVSLSDTLQADVAYGTSAPAPAAVARISTETCNCATPGATNGDTVTAAGQVVTANYGTVTAGTHECAYFDVTIN